MGLGQQLIGKYKGVAQQAIDDQWFNQFVNMMRGQYSWIPKSSILGFIQQNPGVQPYHDRFRAWAERQPRAAGNFSSMLNKGTPITPLGGGAGIGSMMDGMMDIARRQQEIAEELHAHWKDNFKPVEKQVANQALIGLDPKYYAALAASEVNQSFDKGLDIHNRNLLRQGIDPASRRSVNSVLDINLARAAAEAGARNQARLTVTDMNKADKLNAAALGRGLPATAISGLASAGNTMQGAGQLGLGAAGLALDAAKFSTSTEMQRRMTIAQMRMSNNQFAAQMAAQQAAASAANDAAMWGSAANFAGAGFGAAATVKMIATCLPSGTRIDTPEGPRTVDMVQVGDIVTGYAGKPVTVLQRHEYAEVNDQPDRWRVLIFNDGHTVRCCDRHIVDGRPASEYKIGDVAGGKTISNIISSITGVRRSYDLLTSDARGDGGYRIAGIPVQSMITSMAVQIAKRIQEQSA